jgi:putative chitinase
MLQLTERELLLVAPRARREYVDALVTASQSGEMERCGFTTPLRVCNFLAQMCHETGGLTLERENTNWKKARMLELWPSLKKNPKLLSQVMLLPDDEEAKANFIYCNSKLINLGNRPGTNDGYDFRGAYGFQDTGLKAWEEASRYCGVDFVSDPTLYNAAQSVKYWVRKWQNDGFHKLADRHYIRAIGNKINRGSPYAEKEPNGHADRVNWFAKAWLVFGSPTGEAPEVPEGMALGAYGASVEALQVRLRELGYPVGKIDGVFGPGLARSVAAFKFDQRETGIVLEEAEIVGQSTLNALNVAGKAEVAPGRAETTEAEIVAASSTAKAGSEVESAGKGLVAAGVIAGTVQSEVGFIPVESLRASMDWLPGMQSVLTPVASAAVWGIKNAFWAVPLVFGFWFWSRGRHVVMQRLKDHWDGFNLSK